MVKSKKEDTVTKIIPKQFKDKFSELTEIKNVKIDQKSVENVRESLSKMMGLDSPEQMKLVAIKVIFLTKDGVLCETGNQSKGFNEEDWKQ